MPGTGELDPVVPPGLSAFQDVEVTTALAKPRAEKENLRPEHSILMHLGLWPGETRQESQRKERWWISLGKLQLQSRT